MKDIQDYYNELSNHYDKQRSNPYFKLIEKQELSVLHQHINTPNSRVLEIGCGTGIFLKHLHAEPILLYGIDYAHGMLKLAQYKLKDSSTKLIHGSGEMLPYEDNAFDVIYSFKVLPHLPHIDRALLEIHRILHSDGIAILEFYNRHSLRYLTSRNNYFHLWHSPSEIQHLLREANLSIIGIYGIRIITPFAQVMQIPIIKQIFEYMEKSLSTSILNCFAGYYIAICRPK